MHLSNIELYYSAEVDTRASQVLIKGEEYKHITKVMRHVPGELIYVTNGKGKIFVSEITDIKKEYIIALIKDVYSYQNKFQNIFLCLPKIKSADRFEFALEKCAELGITNFIIFESLIYVMMKKQIFQLSGIKPAAC